MANVKINKHVFPQLEGGNMYVAHFEWEGESLPEDTEKVNLSRKGTNPSCWFTPDRAADHDGHSPAHKSEEEYQSYVDRVQKDIESCLSLLEEGE